MTLISSYDNTNDTAQWRQRSINNCENGIQMALAEMQLISEQLMGLATDIEENKGDHAATAGIIKDLTSASIRLEAASRRHEYFTTELRSYDKN